MHVLKSFEKLLAFHVRILNSSRFHHKISMLFGGGCACPGELPLSILTLSLHAGGNPQLQYDLLCTFIYA